MPQTKEHYEIIKFLGVKKILPIITKTDLVDDLRIKTVKKEIEKQFGLSDFLEFSIKDNNCKNEIINKIKENIIKVNDYNDADSFRLPIDRVFNVKGQGVVITGSSISGKVSVGEELELLPQGKIVKVKKIQSFGKDVEKAYKNTRIALNLGGIKKEDVKRGDILSTPEALFSSEIIDVKITTSNNMVKPLKHLESVKFYYLSKEVKARVKFFNKKEINSNIVIYGQLLLDEPLFVSEGDVGILRRLSPQMTIAGIQVVKRKGNFINRKNSNYAKTLEIYEKGNLEEKAYYFISSNPFCNLHELKKELAVMNVEDNIFLKMLDKEKYISFSNKLLSVEKFSEIRDGILDIVGKYHLVNPSSLGMDKEELKLKLNLNVLKNKEYNHLLTLIDDIVVNGSIVKMKNFEAGFSPDEELVKNDICTFLDSFAFSPPKLVEILNNVKNPITKDVYYLLMKRDVLVKIADDVVITKKQYNKLLNLIQDFFASKEILTLPESKVLFETSRKYLVAFLEYLDKVGVTQRVQEGRILRK